MSSVRNAEKTRKSTCAFAERVANLAIEAFDTKPALRQHFHGHQTVLAAMLVHFQAEDDMKVRL